MKDPAFTVFDALTFVFCVSSLAGLTRLLNSEKAVTLRSVVSAMLTAGLFSLGSAMVLWEQFADHHLQVVGISILTGIGTQTSVEFMWSIIVKIVTAAEAKKTKD